MADPSPHNKQSFGRLFSAGLAAPRVVTQSSRRQKCSCHHQSNPAAPPPLRQPVICCMSLQPRLCHPRLQHHTWLLVSAFGHSTHGAPMATPSHHPARVSACCRTVAASMTTDTSVEAALGVGPARRPFTEKRPCLPPLECHKILGALGSFWDRSHVSGLAHRHIR
jgi:hypothetical protein